MIDHPPLLDKWLLGAFIFGLVGTAVLVLTVMTGWSARLDQRILDAIRHGEGLRPDGKPRKLITAARDLTALGGDALRIVILLAFIVELLAGGRRPTAIALFAIYVAARLFLVLLKAVLRRPRPGEGEHGVVSYTSGFPSGHTFMTVVLFLSAAMIIPRDVPTALLYVGIGLALAVTLMIGIARMSFGVHWLSDILAGWFAAIAWVSGCLLLV